jgi:hypothetical protein
MPRIQAGRNVGAASQDWPVKTIRRMPYRMPTA